MMKIGSNQVCIGVYVYANSTSGGLKETLAALAAHTPRQVEILLFSSTPGSIILEALEGFAGRGFKAVDSGEPLSKPACFNRLVRGSEAGLKILLESGAIVTPAWLEQLLTGLAADPLCGLVGPSTNLCWSEQRLPDAPAGQAEVRQLIDYSVSLGRRFGSDRRPLTPLHSLADFCYGVRQEVVETIGAADEGYGFGPCWEMDYNIRAGRAGFTGIWVPAAYVHRRPQSGQRAAEEARLFEANKGRYQDKFCRLRLERQKDTYCRHCRGEDCRHFAPKDLMKLYLGFGNTRGRPRQNLPVLETPLPLVSCIMPTHNRRSLAAQALRYFLRQDYPRRELIIVDDGADPIEDLVPPDPRIRYFYLKAKQTIGAKRNLGCRQAAGEIIVHWDDDDWMAPRRLGYQVECLLKGEADMCGLDKLYFFDPLSRRAWQYVYPRDSRPWLAGGTLCYYKSFWQKNPFPPIDVGEDTRFVWGIDTVRLRALPDNTFYAAMVHHGNTSPKQTENQRWQSIPWQEIERLLAEDLDSYRPLPLISCIMPTYNRRLFVPQAIKYFLRQDYPHKELIVVDDGTDQVEDLMPEIGQVRYIRRQQKAAIGSKRNLAAEQGRGEIIAHWDDDDWYHPSYLSRVARQLPETSDTPVVSGLSSFLVYILEDGLLKVCRVGGIAGATFCYYKSLWRQHPYRDVDQAEDYFFLQDARPRLAALAEPELFAVVRHKDHTWRQERGIEISDYMRRMQNYARGFDKIASRADCQFYEGARRSLYKCARPQEGDR